MDAYPIFLTRLDTQRCVLLGGDYLAERKVRGLLESHAAITVISADLTDPLRTWAADQTITWIPRPYQPGDLHDAFLVIVTECDPQHLASVAQEATAAKALLHVVEAPHMSTFASGSVMRQGPLTVAISTSGASPAFAVRLRRQLAKTLGPEHAALLELMRELRQPLRDQVASLATRRAFWSELMASDVLDLFRSGQPTVARQRADQLLSRKARETAPDDKAAT